MICGVVTEMLLWIFIFCYWAKWKRKYFVVVSVHHITQLWLLFLRSQEMWKWPIFAVFIIWEYGPKSVSNPSLATFLTCDMKGSREGKTLHFFSPLQTCYLPEYKATFECLTEEKWASCVQMVQTWDLPAWVNCTMM